MSSPDMKRIGTEDPNGVYASAESSEEESLRSGEESAENVAAVVLGGSPGTRRFVARRPKSTGTRGCLLSAASHRRQSVDVFAQKPIAEQMQNLLVKLQSICEAEALGSESKRLQLRYHLEGGFYLISLNTASSSNYGLDPDARKALKRMTEVLEEASRDPESKKNAYDGIAIAFSLSKWARCALVNQSELNTRLRNTCFPAQQLHGIEIFSQLDDEAAALERFCGLAFFSDWASDDYWHFFPNSGSVEVKSRFAIIGDTMCYGSFVGKNAHRILQGIIQDLNENERLTGGLVKRINERELRDMEGISMIANGVASFLKHKKETVSEDQPLLTKLHARAARVCATVAQQLDLRANGQSVSWGTLVLQWQELARIAEESAPLLARMKEEMILAHKKRLDPFRYRLFNDDVRVLKVVAEELKIAEEQRLKQAELDLPGLDGKAIADHAEFDRVTITPAPLPHLATPLPRTFDIHSESLAVNYASTSFEVGVAESMGRRPEMEDAHIATEISIKVDGKIHKAAVFGVFDGHTGAKCSAYVRDRMAEVLQQELQTFNQEIITPTGIMNALNMAFVRLEDEYSGDDGTTATLAMIFGDELWVANCGDSRVILQNGSKAVQLTQDQKPEMDRYRKWIQRAGGEVVNGRTGGIVACARSIGDKTVLGEKTRYPLVSPRPKVSVYPMADVRKGRSCLVLGCDGLWDIATTDQVANFCKARRSVSPKTLAQQLVKGALLADSGDNITAMVVRL